MTDKVRVLKKNKGKEALTNQVDWNERSSGGSRDDRWCSLILNRQISCIRWLPADISKSMGLQMKIRDSQSQENRTILKKKGIFTFLMVLSHFNYEHEQSFYTLFLLVSANTRHS